MNKSVLTTRKYSSSPSISHQEIDERVLNVLKAFDKVDSHKVHDL